jgi:aminoglycoside phosphotransferase (APT) family kinase protein
MPALTSRHVAQLEAWLGEWELLHDHSWPLQDTAVLHVRTAERGEMIVKASATSHHLAREIAAHRDHLHALPGLAPELLHFSVEDRILVTRYLPGRLVDAADEANPEVYRQAGALLARLLIPLGTSSEYVAHLRARAARMWPRAEALIDPPLLAAVRRGMDREVPSPVELALTHGDFQPRNWLIHEGRVALIDFGRAAPRPWTSELVRLRHHQLLDRPELERALFDGLGRELDEHDRRLYHLEELFQGLSTVVWASDNIGDLVFAEHGRQMLRRAVATAR